MSLGSSLSIDLLCSISRKLFAREQKNRKSLRTLFPTRTQSLHFANRVELMPLPNSDANS